MLAFDDLLEASHGFRSRNVLARYAGEHFTDEEWLRQKSLYSSCPAHCQLVFIRKLFDAQDGDHVLKVLVALQNLLHASRYVVVLLTDNCRLEDPRVGGQGVDRRVQGLFGQRPVKRDVGVEVPERGDDTRVRVVVCRHVHGLERSN